MMEVIKGGKNHNSCVVNVGPNNLVQLNNWYPNRQLIEIKLVWDEYPMDVAKKILEDLSVLLQLADNATNDHVRESNLVNPLAEGSVK